MSATPQPEEEVQQPAAEGNDPNDFLIAMYGTNVTIRLNSGTVFKGLLQSYDGYLNVALEQATEWSNGVLKRKYGDAFVRGNNVTYISADDL
ncbi:hypothetical protein MBLNU230_g5958t1 [Neophaeotheca triangularis]